MRQGARDKLDVILLLQVGGLAPALEHLMQQLLGHVRALLPAGLLLQRCAQRLVRRLWRRLSPTCATCNDINTNRFVLHVTRQVLTMFLPFDKAVFDLHHMQRYPYQLHLNCMSLHIYQWCLHTPRGRS